MRRKIDDSLKNWIKDHQTKPLLIRGAHGVGKTHAVMHFAQLHFGEGRFVHCDFKNEWGPLAIRHGKRRLDSIFREATDASQIIQGLESRYSVAIRAHETLIVLDEVQLSESALHSIGSLWENGYRVLATASGPRLTSSGKSQPFPSHIKQICMHPLDFEEFLWAIGETFSATAIRRAVETLVTPFNHEDLLQFYYKYIVTGGMPAAVEAHRSKRDWTAVQDVQSDILQSRIGDIANSGPIRNYLLALQIWRSIPNQITREGNNKFRYADIRPGGRKIQFIEPLARLEAMGLILRHCQTQKERSPLMARSNGAFFKLYLSDIGLLYSSLGLPHTLVTDAVICRTADTRLKDTLAENYVKQCLEANGIESLYWVPANNQRMQIEFVVENTMGLAVPIEVKIAGDRQFRALKRYMAKSEAPFAIRISENAIGFEQGILSLPLYAAFCIDENLLRGHWL